MTESLDDAVDQLHLLDRYKVVTNKVWEDIWINELEAQFIDTMEFQRLHWVLQLGTAMFVYPDANHTRFEHALGTMEATQRIVSACVENHRRYATLPIGSYAQLLARVGGLLHDLAQMPYAHTLDLRGEGHLFETEWKNKKLRESLLGPNGFVDRAVREFFKNRSKGAEQQATNLSKNLIPDLDWILSKPQTEDSTSENHELEAPPPDKHYLCYVRDIIGNTLCADLFDYVQRDILSVGFQDRVSLRPLQFFCIKEFRGFPRLALALFKPKNPEKMREDVIFEAIEFLRKRYSLAERVYFHHAKMAASAMIIKAVDSAGLKCEEVWSFGDHALLLHLQSLKGNEGNRVSATIANLLLRRDLFKLAYELRHRVEYAPGETVDEAKENYAKGVNCRENQRALEETLTQALGIGPESLAVYSPDPKMNLKAFEALVWPKGSKDLMPLKDLGDAKPESEELMRKHQRLWRLAVFIKRDLYDKPGFLERVQRLCKALVEGQRTDIDTLAESYAESHKEDFSGGGVSWDNRDKVVAIVRQAIIAKERGGFSFPEVKAVLTELKNQKP